MPEEGIFFSFSCAYDTRHFPAWHLFRGANQDNKPACTHLLPFPLHRHGEQLVRALQPRHPSRRTVKELLYNEKKKRNDKRT